MEKVARLARAYKAYQEAARNQDKDPETFKAARMRYLYLKNGDAWLAQEKRRVESESLDPVINQLRDMYTSLTNEEAVQKTYTDSLATLRDKQEKLSAGAKQQSSFFRKLINEKESKQSAYDRYVELTSPTYTMNAEPVENVPTWIKHLAGYPSSFGMILDIFLAICVIFLLFTLYRSVSGGITMFRAPSYGYSYGSPPFSPVLNSVSISPRPI